ncbi:hypothetical protein EUGRSUZ_E03693 [Eucalyptus grandis]|uniref:Uncharacterized protein n=1 Tax=Eucalyptus grandis TaxID=71139 RepID=A0ACC3KZW4_EUCGR|nr:hypothetical protein EUGRSUZ_E03693 [Eucalyptus grandis]
MPATGLVTNGGKEYPGELTPYVLVTCIVGAMGGLIFGYDIGISVGVTSMPPFLKKFFPSVYETQQGEKVTNQYCQPQLTMSILIPFFQQLPGSMSSCLCPVLSAPGVESDASLMSAVITGLVNVAATWVSIYTVDKLGRRILFLEGGIQMLICQIIITAAIGAKFGVNGTPGELPKWYAGVVVAFICIYVSGFAWSWGPLGWLVPSEIFPLEIRSAAQSINVSVNMIFTFLIAQVFLNMLCHMKFGLFLFFAFFVLVASIFIYFFLPETKGIPIEEMGTVWKKHWYWARFVGEDDSPSGGIELGGDGQNPKRV